MILATLNILLFLLIYIDGKRLFPKSLSLSLLFAFLSYLFLIEGIVLILGLAGVLYFSLISAALLVLIVFLLYAALRQGCKLSFRFAFSIKSLKRSEIALLIILAVFLLLHFAQSTLLPPVGCDSFEYHIVSPLWWLQSHKITPHYFNTSGTEANYAMIDGYPKSMDILCYWCLLLFGDVYWANSYNLVIIVVLLLSVAFILESLQVAEKGPKLFAFLIFLSIPLVMIHSATLYTDVPLAAFLTATVTIGIYILSNPRDKWGWYLICISGGLLAGCKFTGLSFFLVIVAILLVWLSIRNRGLPFPRGERGEFLKRLPLLLFIFLIVGGVWYVWNSRQYGSPFYPTLVYNKQEKAFESKVLALPPQLYGGEFVKHPWRSLINAFLEVDPYIPLDSPRTGLGAFSFILGLPSFFWAVFHALKTKNRVLGFVILCFFLCFLFQPYRYYPRYIMYLSVLFIVCFVKLLTELKAKFSRRFLYTLASLLISYQVIVAAPFLTGRYVLPENIIAMARSGYFDFLNHSHSFNFTGYNFCHDDNLIPQGSVTLIYDYQKFALLQKRHLGLRMILIDQEGNDALDAAIKAHNIQYVIFGNTAIERYKGALHYCLDHPGRFQLAFKRFVPEEYHNWPGDEIDHVIFKVLQ
jgi:hypothetical protein